MKKILYLLGHFIIVNGTGNKYEETKLLISTESQNKYQKSSKELYVQIMGKFVYFMPMILSE